MFRHYLSVRISVNYIVINIQTFLVYAAMETLILLQFSVLLHSYVVNCHLPSYASTPSNKIEQYCMLADSCLHDTIPICGQMGEEQRTFLDLCDLLEFACDTNQIYSHIEDTPTCPVFKDPKIG